MKVALLGTLACEQQERLIRTIDPAAGLEFMALPDEMPAAALAAALAEVPALVTMRYDRTMPPAPKLRVVQVGGTGYDGIDFGYLPAGTVVCNAYGHEVPIAEYVILAMLQWCTRFMEAERSFRVEGHWRLGGRTAGPYQDELAGKTVGILGMGRVGRVLAPRARGMDTTVIACTRHADALPAEVSWATGYEGIDEFLGRSDFVVVACALTPETDGLLDRARLGRMKRSGVLINVSRGPVVEEKALFRALESGAIGGAVIDAWYRYPTRDDLTIRPSRFPFHQLPNVYMTPHSSAWTSGMIGRRWAEIGANLSRFARGEPLLNVVHRG